MRVTVPTFFIYANSGNRDNDPSHICPSGHLIMKVIPFSRKASEEYVVREGILAQVEKELSPGRAGILEQAEKDFSPGRCPCFIHPFDFVIIPYPSGCE